MAYPRGAPFGKAWLCLCLALLVHVADEALTGFLGVYNPTVTAFHQRVPWLPLPTFEFRTWLAGLLGAVVVLLSLTGFAARGARWLRPLGDVFAAVMIANALGHTAGTLAGRSFFDVPTPHPMPGFYSSPLLLAASFYLLWCLHHGGHGSTQETIAS